MDTLTENHIMEMSTIKMGLGLQDRQTQEELQSVFTIQDKRAYHNKY